MAAVDHHAFVDESFEREYVLVAAILRSGEINAARQAIRAFLDKRQRRLHFKDESAARKHAFLSLLDGLQLKAQVAYDHLRAHEDLLLVRL